MASRFALGVAILLGPGGKAQTAVDGAVTGRVVLADGRPASGVRVSLSVVDDAAAGTANGRWAHSSLERVVSTDTRGSFVALRLLPGEYIVQALLNGIEAEQRVLVELGVVSDTTLRIPVAARGSAAARSGLSVKEVATRTSETFDSAVVQQVPIQDRRFENVAQLSSEVQVVEDEATDLRASENEGQQRRAEEHPDGAALLSFRGLAPTQNVSLLDGVSSDQVFRGGTRGGAAGGARSGSTFAESAVGRFRVAPHGYSAQYGGAAGGALTTASARGGAAGHGGGFYSVRTAELAATNPFSVVTHYHDGVITSSLVKPGDVDQQIGGHIGGPIAVKSLHSKLAGFLSVEEQRRSFAAQSSPAVAEFYALTPLQLNVLANRAVTAPARIAALNYLDSLTGLVPRSSQRGLEFVRLDLRASTRDAIAGSYTRSRLSSPAGSGSGPSSAVVARGTASVGDSTVRVDAATGRWLHLFGGRLTDELRGQYARDIEFETPRVPLAQEPGIGPGGYAPQVSIDGAGGGDAFRYGTPAALGRRAYPDERRVQAAESVQWAPHSHLFTVGADWSRVDEKIDALNNTDGSFTYDSGVTGGRAGGLVDWITDYTFNVRAYPNGGCPLISAPVHNFCFRSFTQSFGQSQSEFVLHEFAGFAQDLWRVRAGLTVELGARYEYLLLPLPQQPNAALDAVFRASGGTSTFPEDRNNVGPRVSVAWSPRDGRWGTLRAGYGTYFGRLQGSTVRSALVDTALASTATHIRITPETVTVCPQVAGQGFGYPCAYVSAPPTAIAATTSATLFASRFRLPVVQQAELTLEREWRGVLARATYSGAWATQLPDSVDINIVPSTTVARFALQGGDGRAGVKGGETFAVPLYTARLASQFGPVTMLESNANATWNALTMETRLRERGGVSLRGSYTWSKAIDYGAEQGVVPKVNGQFDPFNVRVDKGLADANVPHRFAGDVIWLTRLRTGPRLLREAATGWRVTGLGTASSGRAYSYEIFGGTRLSGGAYSINASGGSTYLPTVGRNTLRLPARWDVDARVARDFRVSDRVRGEGYVAAFNVANHANASRVNARAFLVGTTVNGVTPLVFQDAGTVTAEGLNTTAFGTVTSTTAGIAAERHVQLGLRIDF